ncbi:sialidase family protein [Cytophagaceae bacterium ABcell3]|nr:sialidase family protein [Cytophagaceae bacterium ABcell3]
MKKQIYAIIITVTFAAVAPIQSFAQKIYTLPSPLNQHLISETQPCLSANGRTMVYRADSGEDNEEEIVISHQKSGRWSRPQPVPGINTRGKVFTSQHHLSADGNTIVFTSNRYGGLGDKDLWYVEKTASGGWTAPQNFGKPINSSEGEGDPALSPDGRSLYFVKYNGQKSPSGLPCGTIMVSKMKGRNMWEEPAPLPAPINKGCECNPRLLSDGRTMTFASVRDGGKGGFDQYITQMGSNGEWSEPKPFEPVNTEEDDLYITIPASGKLVYFSAIKNDERGIAMTMIPEHLQPDPVMLQFGNISDSDGNKLNARLILTDLNTEDMTIFNNGPDGSYLLCLPKNKSLDFAIQANETGYFWYSTPVNTDSLDTYKEVVKNITLEKVVSGFTVDLKDIDFTTASKEFTGHSTHQLNRLARLIKDLPEKKFYISIAYPEIISDTIHHEELTEVKHDTLEKILPQESEDDIIEKKEFIIQTIYHNDRTQREANLIETYLTKKGVQPLRLKAEGLGAPKNKTVDKPRTITLRVE